MNRDQNLVRQELSKFFTSHPDAAAFFVVAGLELEYVRMAIYGVTAEKVEPGDKRGYAEIIRRVVAQRERDRLQKATSENPALGIGTSPSAASPADLPPPVMSLRQLDPKNFRGSLVVGESDFCATGRSTTNDRAARRGYASTAGSEWRRWRPVQDAADDRPSSRASAHCSDATR